MNFPIMRLTVDCLKKKKKAIIFWSQSMFEFNPHTPIQAENL